VPIVCGISARSTGDLERTIRCLSASRDSNDSQTSRPPVRCWCATSLPAMAPSLIQGFLARQLARCRIKNSFGLRASLLHHFHKHFPSFSRIAHKYPISATRMCGESRRTDYRFAAAMSHGLPLTRKISDGANSHCQAIRLLNRLAQLAGQQHAPDGVWISRIRVLEHSVCREFTPVFAKHSKSFWLIDSLAAGVDRMQRNFGPMQKKGSKGRMTEKGIDRRHRPAG
jgi:hypothetical protein